MNIEQRLAAVEKALADLTTQQKTTEEISRLMRETAIEAIKRENRPGWVIHKSSEKATRIKAAAFKIEHSSVYISPAKISASVLE